MKEYPLIRTFTINNEHDAVRLDRAAAAHCPELSRTGLRRLIEDGAVTVDDAVITLPARKVRLGQTVSLTIPEPDPAAPQPQNLPLELLYDDPHLSVINKPVGMASHPAPGTPDGTVVNALLGMLPDLSGIGGVLRPGIVHRLDKNTSGLMVIAKNDRTHFMLARQFAARTVRKVY